MTRFGAPGSRASGRRRYSGSGGSRLCSPPTTISHNGTGIQNSGSVRLSNSDLILNTAAIAGSVQSFTNNRFSNNGTDGCSPCDSLILDAAGNLYGTTSGCGVYGYGTVFEIKP